MSKSAAVLYFSPTNTTKKICFSIAEGMGEENPQIIDMTRPEIREEIISDPDILTSDIYHLIVGAPVYFGKLPVEVKDCIKSINGKGSQATAVVVYGNRDYGKALSSLVKILLQNNFRVTSAGAFIGQHSYADIVPVAVGRPDQKDLDNACLFGKRSKDSSGFLSVEDIPVQRDIFSGSDKYIPVKPTFISKRCVKCGICADVCPLGILSSETGELINKEDKDNCIGCMACVSSCNKEARIAEVNLIMKFSMKYILRKAAIERQEPLHIYP